MTAARRPIALLLLLAFVAGGVAAPVLHRVDHAHEHEAAHAAAAAQDNHVHTGTPTFTYPLEGALDGDVVCVLCKVGSAEVRLARGAGVPFSPVAGPTPAPSADASVHVAGLHLIRGPPSA